MVILQTYQKRKTGFAGKTESYPISDITTLILLSPLDVKQFAYIVLLYSSLLPNSDAHKNLLPFWRLGTLWLKGLHQVKALLLCQYMPKRKGQM